MIRVDATVEPLFSVCTLVTGLAEYEQMRASLALRPGEKTSLSSNSAKAERLMAPPIPSRACAISLRV